LIPHNFGFDKMEKHILTTEDQVKEKLKMLEAISDMKVTVKLLKESNDEEVAVIDQNYKKLGCNIKTLEKKSKEFKLLSEYFENTKGYYNKVTLGEIY
jgi:poly [ADP-ribose] polymerase